MKHLIEKLEQSRRLTGEEYLALLQHRDPPTTACLRERAVAVRGYQLL